jgi:hypothetical protein
MIPGYLVGLHPLRTPAWLAIVGLYSLGVLNVLKAAVTAASWPLTGALGGFAAVLSLLLILATAYTFVTFLIWLYQARENLDLRGETGMRWAKGWRSAAGSYPSQTWSSPPGSSARCPRAAGRAPSAVGRCPGW